MTAELDRQGETVSRLDRGRRFRRRLSGLMVLAGVAIGGLVAVDFARFAMALDEREPQFSGKADGIVALTGGAERISDAITLLAEGRARRLLITGVNQATSDESVAATAPDRAELLDCCIDLDRNALNTVGNALEAARWVERHHFRSLI